MKELKENLIGKMRWKLFLLGLVKIPLIHFVKPKLLRINEDTVEVKVRLKRRTKNHLNSMYFGALAVGADIAAGIFAFYFAEKMERKVSFAFKSMDAKFLMRAESDVIFRSTEGELVKQAMVQSEKTGGRVNQLINVSAINQRNEEVARFVMEVSVKVK